MGRRILIPSRRIHHGGELPDPSTIANLDLWHNSDLGVTEASNNVSSWIGQATGYDLAQGVGANQPNINTNQINGHPTIEFNGSTDFLRKAQANYLSGSNTFTAFCIFKYASGQGNHFFSTADEASGDHYLLFSTQSSTDRLAIQAFDSGASPTNRVESTTVLVDGNNYYAIWESNGSAWNLRLNGAAEIPIVAVGSNTGQSFDDITARDNMVIGALKRSTTGYGTPKMSQFGIYSQKISAGDITTLEAYLAQQSGV